MIFFDEDWNFSILSHIHFVKNPDNSLAHSAVFTDHNKHFWPIGQKRVSANQLIGRCQNSGKASRLHLGPNSINMYGNGSNSLLFSEKLVLKESILLFLMFQTKLTMILLWGMKSRVKGVMKFNHTKLSIFQRIDCFIVNLSVLLIFETFRNIYVFTFIKRFDF